MKVSLIYTTSSIAKANNVLLKLPKNGAPKCTLHRVPKTIVGWKS